MAVRTRRATGRALPGWGRVRPWHGDPTAVHLTVLSTAGVTPDAVRRLGTDLAQQGVVRVVTSALDPGDTGAFVDAGYRVRHELDLLGRDLSDLSDLAGRGRRTGPPARTRRARPGTAVLDLDRRAFGDEWALDREALADALNATTIVHLRVSGTPAAPTGFAITGAAGRRAYVQRLAVSPDAQRSGLATILLADGLRWARRRGARDAVVNTQSGNAAARGLYEGCGFSAFPVGLWVLEATL